MLGFYLGLVAILLWWFLVLVPDAWLSALGLYVLLPLIALLAFMLLIGLIANWLSCRCVAVIGRCIEAEYRLGQ